MVSSSTHIKEKGLLTELEHISHPHWLLRKNDLMSLYAAEHCEPGYCILFMPTISLPYVFYFNRMVNNSTPCRLLLPRIVISGLGNANLSHLSDIYFGEEKG